jgi:succinate dehydrogenase / fumarate reductase flavoprotein subunit
MPSHDLLIIGAGLAGQRAALAALTAGATVGIVSKVHPVRSHSVAAAGGINAALNPEDTWESHAFDTIKGSDYLGDQDAIEIMCREAPDEILYLEHIGVTFHRSDTGHLGTRAFGGASAARTYYVADITGQAILHVLYEQLMKHHEQLDRYEEWFTTDLLQDDDGRCVGAICRNLRDGRLEVFNAKAVILASGGAGQVYEPTTNGLIVTGDGMAQAYRIGARLQDMEMVQYHPTCLAGNGILITEGARGEGAWLLNAKGERFMERYAPNKLELASRDVVSRAEQTEINEGRGFPDGTVALDITKVPRHRTLEALREIVNIGRDFAGVDITREPIHIRPGNHYMMGGVKTDSDGQTSVPGLYAAGEVACVSVHGGNRLGANSLLDTLIFGRRSGEHAAAQAKGVPLPSTPSSRVSDTESSIAAIMRREPGGRRVASIKQELGKTMNVHVAVFRDAEGLAKAHEVIQRLKEEAPKAAIDDRGSLFNQDVIGAIELGYMLDVAETIVAAAEERKESRGAYTRTDFPGRNDDDWLKHIDISVNGADPPKVSYSPVTITRWEPQERTYLVSQYTLSIRRYDPESADAAHWEEHTVELESHHSVLEAILKAKDEHDGSIGIRCSRQQGICGSCGVRINGKPGLACNTHLEQAANRTRGRPVIEVEPIGNMPVLTDLIVDMDAVHWKNIRRVTPWLVNKQPIPEREYVVPREHMIDVTQPMACIQCGA